jgi:hypothetical protein
MKMTFKYPDDRFSGAFLVAVFVVASILVVVNATDSQNRT